MTGDSGWYATEKGLLRSDVSPERPAIIEIETKAIMLVFFVAPREIKENFYWVACYILFSRCPSFPWPCTEKWACLSACPVVQVLRFSFTLTQGTNLLPSVSSLIPKLWLTEPPWSRSLLGFVLHIDAPKLAFSIEGLTAHQEWWWWRFGMQRLDVVWKLGRRF